MHMWKQHFENLLETRPRKLLMNQSREFQQLDIKLGPFTQGELDSDLRKIKNRKATGLYEIPPGV